MIVDPIAWFTMFDWLTRRLTSVILKLRIDLAYFHFLNETNDFSCHDFSFGVLVSDLSVCHSYTNAIGSSTTYLVTIFVLF